MELMNAVLFTFFGAFIGVIITRLWLAQKEKQKASMKVKLPMSTLTRNVPAKNTQDIIMRLKETNLNYDFRIIDQYVDVNEPDQVFKSIKSTLEMTESLVDCSLMKIDDPQVKRACNIHFANKYLAQFNICINNDVDKTVVAEAAKRLDGSSLEIEVEVTETPMQNKASVKQMRNRTHRLSDEHGSKGVIGVVLDDNDPNPAMTIKKAHSEFKDCVSMQSDESFGGNLSASVSDD